MQVSTEHRATMIVTDHRSYGNKMVHILVNAEGFNQHLFMNVNSSCYSEGVTTQLLKLSDFNSLDELIDTPFSIRVKLNNDKMYYGHSNKHIWVNL